MPEGVSYASPWVRVYNEDTVEEALQDSFDRLDEHRGMVFVRSTRYQQELCKYQSKHVQPLSFSPGDLVLRCVRTKKGKTKFSPPWEGPYIVAEVLQPGTYKLATMDGQVFKNAWNVELLQRFYT